MDAPESLSEAEIQARRVEEEANNWDIPTLDRLESPSDGELPIINLATLHSNNPTAINDVARQLSHIFKNTGFFLLSNHGYETVVAETLEAAKRFHHALTQEEKDRISFGEKGVGYIKMNQKILPKRKKGNMNETFIVKRELGPRNITLESNPFPEESKLPGFKEQVLKYADCMEKLALSLLPSIAVALDLESNYFDAAFTQPLFRLRLSHYPPANLESSQYGIAPHTDTSFFTLLAQDGTEGLSVSTLDGRWIKVPSSKKLLVVNTGELLKQWSNDRVPSTRHFVINNSGIPRYSLPFFFNCNADYVMECLPSCTSANNPPKYPPMSFLQSQGVLQGE